MTATSLVALALSTGLAACGSGSDGLDGTYGQGTSAGVSVVPGEPADYTATLRNTSSHDVTLESATLLPLAGFRAPSLRHLAVEAGRQYAAADRGWPPQGSGYDLRPFAGYRVAPGRLVQIMYSVQTGRLGQVADAGVRVRVRVGGGDASVDVMSVAGTCIDPPGHVIPCPNAFQNRLQDDAAHPHT